MTPECDKLGLVASRIEEPADVELLRQLRNVQRAGFAHDNNPITPQAQREWWADHSWRVRGYLYWSGDSERFLVGYGLLRYADGRWYSSVAVSPDATGRGYGGAITADVVRRIETQVWAEARQDNPAAIRLHRAADWEQYAQKDGLLYFRTRPHVYGAQQTTANWFDEAWPEWAKEGWAIT